MKAYRLVRKDSFSNSRDVSFDVSTYLRFNQSEDREPSSSNPFSGRDLMLRSSKSSYSFVKPLNNPSGMSTETSSGVKEYPEPRLLFKRIQITQINMKDFWLTDSGVNRQAHRTISQEYS